MYYKIMKFPGFRDKALTLSYDDGVIYDRKLVEIMDKYGLKGTFNLNSGLFSENSERRFSKQEALSFYRGIDHEIAVHGKRHYSLPDVPASMATEDVINDRVCLEEMFGRTITGMAYPFGTYDDSVVEILKRCGIQYSRTVMSTEKFDIPKDWLRLHPTCHHDNPRLMELAKEFVEYKQPVHYASKSSKLFYLWGHSYEFNDKDNWDVIEKFAEYIGNREDIWYATNIEIYRYVKAFESLVFGANGLYVYNPSATDVCITFFGNDYLIKAGKTTSIDKHIAL